MSLEVRLEGLTVGYGAAPVLERTDLVFPAGSFTALLGPSGCGKSTVLNTVAGFVRPASGRVTAGSVPVEGPGPERGVVFQHYALFPWRTARGNVEFALKRLGLSRRERRERALAALAEVGLADGAHKYPAQLSGGMQQRVALARALAAEPEVLLMDEPFGALDALTRGRMQDLLRELWRRSGTTVVFVTHDIDEALALAGRVVVLGASPGRVLADHPVPPGPPDPDLRALIARHLTTT
ncbi:MULTISPECIES: ABC transporter ATP-binding protein [Streptomyces]|uniref:ATP-binding cassette domain-containing protein n=1 Tax=Streptomyces katrae TaxID=68223 RepID=A0ABT7GNV1_9ACTN|nr:MULTISPECIES: ATP-binding cassette domain-containing protein [Streptomyces]MDK9495266.1 ATP-binding cassette domain-containing protein [Streptomyces katrae]RST06820.1 ATP-binding cassette domain-containing protein [Streptomyces sp. WAC07149]GLX16982.1 ABC transporter ATP-binding protein [Streptomyces lavendulae subsp. lavendulae]GLX29489.1 ABC transporter ATP-binding protein [Streptomyces lavendulae subsp. lavendulae]